LTPDNRFIKRNRGVKLCVTFSSFFNCIWNVARDCWKLSVWPFTENCSLTQELVDIEQNVFIGFACFDSRHTDKIPTYHRPLPNSVLGHSRYLIAGFLKFPRICTHLSANIFEKQNCNLKTHMWIQLVDNIAKCLSAIGACLSGEMCSHRYWTPWIMNHLSNSPLWLVGKNLIFLSEIIKFSKKMNAFRSKF